MGKSQPGSFQWFDAGGTSNSEYFIEAVDMRGQLTAHEAIKPAWSASLPIHTQSELLANLGATGRAASKQEEFPDLPLTRLQESSAQGIGGASINDQWNLMANQPALKIGVRADGWYRITQTEMAAAGFTTSADARNLRLFVGGNEIAMRTSRDSGALTAADYVEFWGQGLDVATTDTQIYWLVNGAQAGKRIAIAGEVSTNVGAESAIGDRRPRRSPVRTRQRFGLPVCVEESQAAQKQKAVGRRQKAASRRR